MRRRKRLAPLVAAAAFWVSFGASAAELPPGIGAADRRFPVDLRRPPWNAIAKVQTNIATRCTGTLIGPETVMTAAHCIYNCRTLAFLRPGSLHVLLGYERGGYRWHAQVARYVVGDRFDPSEPARHPGSDWALLELAASVPSAIEPLRMAKDLPARGTAVALPGYNQDRSHVLMADTSCRITGIFMVNGARMLSHDCSATRGTSGGPLLAERDNHWEVVGINIAVTPSASLALPVSGLEEAR